MRRRDSEKRQTKPHKISIIIIIIIIIIIMTMINPVCVSISVCVYFPCFFRPVV